MHALLIGADEDDLRARAARMSAWSGNERSVDGYRAEWLAGTPDEIVARLRAYEAAGVERVMLQHLLVRDEAALELLAAEVMPAFA